MSVSIGAVSFSRLTAQPLGYDETDTRRGFTARKWAISGLVTPSEYVSLIGIYDAWRNTKITEDDPLVTNSTGATVNFSGDGPGSLSWANVGCWFSSAPQGEQNGAYITCSVEVVDAGQALQVLIANQAADATNPTDEAPDLGTININGAVLTLMKPPDTYQSVPSLELTAGGISYINGTKVPVEVQDIEGETNLAGWTLVRAWFAERVASTPLVGTWYPISVPTASAQKRIVSGAATTVYTVTLQRAKVK